METFAAPRDLLDNPRYERDRREALAELDLHAIDGPIRDLVRDLALLPQCFTLQCCWGHFVSRPGQDPQTLERVPADQRGPVRYRIAYLALCIENSPAGMRLMEELRGLAIADPSTVQFGSPEWFATSCPNAYALQVEPEHSMLKDEAVLTHDEAVYVQSVRDRFFVALRGVVARELRASACSGSAAGEHAAEGSGE